MFMMYKDIASSPNTRCYDNNSGRDKLRVIPRLAMCPLGIEPMVLETQEPFPPCLMCFENIWTFEQTGEYTNACCNIIFCGKI